MQSLTDTMVKVNFSEIDFLYHWNRTFLASIDTNCYTQFIEIIEDKLWLNNSYCNLIKYQSASIVIIFAIMYQA